MKIGIATIVITLISCLAMKQIGDEVADQVIDQSYASNMTATEVISSFKPKHHNRHHRSWENEGDDQEEWKKYDWDNMTAD